jgi:probable F420-dependent oxidoreductase
LLGEADDRCAQRIEVEGRARVARLASRSWHNPAHRCGRRAHRQSAAPRRRFTATKESEIPVMNVGVLTEATDRSLDAATVARIAESAGIESVYFGEHSHIPASRETPYPGGDGTMPPGYERILDLFVVLTMAAQATSEIRIGTGICQLSQRDPILTAKAVASVDLISNGRLVLITGSSWNIEEMRNHGTDPATRYELVEERALAMREIWAQDEASFHGRFVNFDRIWSWPKPVQDPMPVFIGGNSPGSEERALRVGTGWAPIHAPGMPERVRRYLESAAAEGLPTSVIAVGGELSAQLLDDYANAGAERWIHGIPIFDDEGELNLELERVLAVQAEFTGIP